MSLALTIAGIFLAASCVLAVLIAGGYVLARIGDALSRLWGDDDVLRLSKPPADDSENEVYGDHPYLERATLAPGSLTAAPLGVGGHQECSFHATASDEGHGKVSTIERQKVAANEPG
jgi:hypothetical protein